MEELVLKAQHGDEEAFTDLILMIEHDLFKIAKMRLVNEADIDDAIQDTMIETFKSIRNTFNMVGGVGPIMKHPDQFNANLNA